MSSRPVVLVTGAAKRLGRSIALDLGAHGFDVAVHYRASAAEADEVVVELTRLGATAAAFGADLSSEAACRALVPDVVARLGRLDAIVNNASTFEYDTVETFGYGAMERHWRANTGPPIVLAGALHRHLSSRSATGCVVNLLDQKLWNPNPDHLSYTLSKAALQAATVALAQALAPTVQGVRRRTRGDTAVGADEHRAVRSGAADDAARALVDAGRHRLGRALPDRRAGDHRDDAAGRRRPAPCRPAARRAVPERRGELTCTASSAIPA